MFSGIVESVEPILASVQIQAAVRIVIKKPSHFDDLKIGDSIACNGICLTVESFNEAGIGFTMAAETLKVLGGGTFSQSQSDFQVDTQFVTSQLGKKINLERSLKFGDRIHGHLVSGHVDSLAKVENREDLGDSLILGFRYASHLQPLIWLKGSITLNGVSLTVNKCSENYLEVCLIPETLKRTNLKDLKVGDVVTVEPDYMAKSMHQYFENQNNILKTNFEKNKNTSEGHS